MILIIIMNALLGFKTAMPGIQFASVWIAVPCAPNSCFLYLSCPVDPALVFEFTKLDTGILNNIWLFYNLATPRSEQRKHGIKWHVYYQIKHKTNFLPRCKLPGLGASCMFTKVAFMCADGSFRCKPTVEAGQWEKSGQQRVTRRDVAKSVSNSFFIFLFMIFFFFFVLGRIPCTLVRRYLSIYMLRLAILQLVYCVGKVSTVPTLVLPWVITKNTEPLLTA